MRFNVQSIDSIATDRNQNDFADAVNPDKNTNAPPSRTMPSTPTNPAPTASPAPPAPSVFLFRGVGILILFLSITVCGFQVLGAVDAAGKKDDTGRSLAPLEVPVLFLPAVLTLLGGIAMATLLEGLARLIASQRPAADTSSALSIRLLSAITELQDTLPALAAQPPPAPAPALPEPTPAIPQFTAIEQQMERMIKLLEEMKDVSMLDETQRQNRRKQTSQRRKTARLEEATRFINKQNWEEADALLHLLESLHPGDAEVQACRTQLRDARIAIQADEWETLRLKAEELLAITQYDEALEAVTAFLDRFPAHPDCQQLAQRIRHDIQVRNEALSSRMYDEIKTTVESRQWRSALVKIQQFLNVFPDHIRATKIRGQVRVIQKNAEIEERHEQEDRIRAFVTARQYTQAAELAEDLLARFPDSPQSAYLTGLLPKLRERAAGDPQGVGT